MTNSTEEKTKMAKNIMIAPMHFRKFTNFNS